MTKLEIRGEQFCLNGVPTYQGRSYEGRSVEGLLFNNRVVQVTFDEDNASTQGNWAYPDTGRWDPDRNVDEFIAALPEWLNHGVLGITVNLQGGMPILKTERDQPWSNTAFNPDGALKEAYLARLAKVLDAADRLGMVVIVGYYYFGQDERIADEAAVIRGVENATKWLLESGHENLIIEINNECDVPLYEQPILQPARVHELIQSAQGLMDQTRSIPVSTSYRGGGIPSETVLERADLALVHGNGQTPDQIVRMVNEVRAMKPFKERPRPIVFNEDSVNVENLDAAFSVYASWGYYDQGDNNYRDGFQSPPVNWTISTAEKRRFFSRVAEIVGAKSETGVSAVEGA